MSKKMCLPKYVKKIIIVVISLLLCFNGLIQFGNSTRLLKQNFDVDLKNIKGTEANVKHGSGPNNSTYIPSPPKKIKY